MKFHPFVLIAAVLVIASAASAQNAAAVWQSVTQAAFDPAKSATVENVEITRDRIHITLERGTIQFGNPANGRVFAAAFEGKGKIHVDPPNNLEKQQLQLLTKADAVDTEFSEATFSFTDGFFDEIASQVKWSPAADNKLASLYQKRQEEREGMAAEIVPHIFRGVLSADQKRTAYLCADLKTDFYGWVLARYDALDPEEVSIGRWAPGAFPGLFDTWMHFPAGGRSSAAAFQDPTERFPFLIRGYKIDASVTTGAELAATTTMSVEEKVSGERVIVLDLSANLRVDSVKLGEGKSLEYFQPEEPKDRYPTYGDYLAIALPQPSQAGQSLAIEVHYAGKRVIRKEGEGNFFCPSYGWYPALPDNFAMRSDFDITFHYPKKFTLVATGAAQGEPKDGVGEWKSEIPLAVAGFAYGAYKVSDEKVGPVDVEVFVNQNPNDTLTAIQHAVDSDLPGAAPSMGIMPMGVLNASSHIKEMNTEVSNSLRVFQDYFGAYPYSHLAVTDIPYSYGQGWPGLLYLSMLSFLDPTQRHALGISAKGEMLLTDFFRAHETSHQWWGHRVGWKSYHDQWMSEGFAQFSGNLYVEFRENKQEFLNRLREDRQDLMNKNQFGHENDSLGPVWMGERLRSSQAPRGYDVVIYDKGGWVLHMLRMMLEDPRNPDPDHLFKDMMHDFTQTYDNRPASTMDFKAIVEKHMLPHMDAEKNGKLDWFFREYVYGTGIPHYEFTSTVSEDSGKWKVQGRLEQSGVPDGWVDILPVYVHAQNKTLRIGWARTAGKSTPITFLLPFKPDKVDLNEDEDMIAVVKQ